MNSSGYTNPVQMSSEGVGFDIQEHVKVDSIEMDNQPTGTPTNTSTPAGYMQLTLNGSTVYLPYYT